VQPPSSTIQVPPDGQWYGPEAGYTLDEISGTSVEYPLSGPGSGGAVTNVQVQVRRGNDDSKCWSGDLFNEPCGGASSWLNMTLSASSWTYDTAGLWGKTDDGITYRVRLRGYDSALAADGTSDPNLEVVSVDKEKSFKVDKSTPAAMINVPNTYTVYSFTGISGTAADANSGIRKVQVAFYSETDGAWWDPATAGDFTRGTPGSDPPDDAFVDASTDTAVPVNWTVGTSSIPVMNNGQVYHIRARAMDRVGNKTAFPASTTNPPVQSSYIRIEKAAPSPNSTITSPAAGEQQHFSFTGLTTIVGTMDAGNTVQLRITDVTASPNKVWTPGGWISTTTWLAGCAPDAYVVGQSTCGFYGTANLTWNRNVTGIWPSGTNRIKVESRAASEEGSSYVLQATYGERYFVIDDNNPTASVTSPGAAYARAVTEISGQASDTDPGIITGVEITISTGITGLSSYWNGAAWQTDPFWLPVSAQDMTFDSANEPWVLSSGLPEWVDGKAYWLQRRVTDKADHVVTLPSGGSAVSFIVDTTSPTTTVQVPNDPGNPGVNSMASISGIAWDNGRNNAIYVAIRNEATSLWYSTITGFNVGGVNPAWIPVSAAYGGTLSPDATSWLFAPSGLESRLASGAKFLILARSTDVAGNMESTYVDGASSTTVLWDITAPVSYISRPSAGGSYKRLAIGQVGLGNYLEGTAYDRPDAPSLNSGVEGAKIRLSYLLDGDTYYCMNAGFSSGTYT
ncbi:MAG: hypothetical protein COT18_08105, partial [Elusimicrobia bacterium CG08_land_8_20_14_0_20_59_10]